MGAYFSGYKGKAPNFAKFLISPTAISRQGGAAFLWKHTEIYSGGGNSVLWKIHAFEPRSAARVKHFHFVKILSFWKYVY
jgi:hypothetical protein